MRGLYITGISLSFVLIIVFVALGIAYEDYWRRDFNSDIFDSFRYNTFDSYSYNRSYRSELDTLYAIFYILSFLMIAFFLFLDILGLAKIKRTTTQVLSIIGICISGIMGMVAIVAGISEGPVYQFVPIWILYLLITMAFSIVGIVQASRWLQMKKIQPHAAPINSELDFFK